MQLASTVAGFRLRQFLSLTKPRVVSLIVFCAVIGMYLAAPGWVPPKLLLAATLGIWLVAGAAAAVNCLVEQKIDAVMTRTRARPLPRGELTSLQTLAFAGALGGAGLWVLYNLVNPLTMWLTFATFIGYAVIYTVLLKPMTPQNIVIGGASGAMPPVLGWAAVTGEVAPEALLLFLIIFAWTPPHFWALALYRTEDFARAGLPMLPVTHGHRFTRLYVLLYTLILFASALFRSERVSVRTLSRLVLVAFALAGCSGSGPSFRNTDITGADYGRDFTLADHTGKTRTLADFRGKVVVMFFGYTRCPDVCPTTLAELKAVKEQLGEDGKKLQVLFVTVDPERDTRKLLADYVPAFDPSFLGLYGDSAAIASCCALPAERRAEKSWELSAPGAVSRLASGQP